MQKKLIDLRTILIALVVAGLVGATLFGYRFYHDATREAAIGGAFRLIDQDGQLTTDQDFQGKYMLVYFGYTYCPDICPLSLQIMTDAIDRLGEKGSAIQPIFVTVDPTRDTSDHLKDYIANFHPRFKALTGAKDDLEKIAKAYRAYFAPSQDDGLIDHSSVIYVMDKKGRYLTHLSAGATADDLVAKLDPLP